jgi:hypothetical protein
MITSTAIVSQLALQQPEQCKQQESAAHRSSFPRNQRQWTCCELGREQLEAAALMLQVEAVALVLEVEVVARALHQQAVVRPGGPNGSNSHSEPPQRKAPQPALGAWRLQTGMKIDKNMFGSEMVTVMQI